MNYQELSKQVTREVIEYNDSLVYFNIEISRCSTTLCINASKKGIDAFLKLYGGSLPPPQEILVQALRRPQRNWASWRIHDNEKATSSDPTPYKAFGNALFNRQVNDLHIQFLQDNSDKLVFNAVLRDGCPLLIVNKKGWEQFLRMLLFLRDRKYWFYVTVPHTDNWSHLPFQLTPPINSKDHVFKALECIRLEPDETIFLQASIGLEDIELAKQDRWNKDPIYLYGASIQIEGNSSGLLLLSKWMHDFAENKALSKDICNYCEAYPSNFTEKDIELPTPQWIHLYKTELDSPYPMFSLGGKDNGRKDLYVIGNPKGFEEFSEVLEELSFIADHEPFSEKEAEKQWKHFRGKTTKGLTVDNKIRLLNGWHLIGGGYFNTKYYDSEWMEEDFINRRVVRDYAEN